MYYLFVWFVKWFVFEETMTAAVFKKEENKTNEFAVFDVARVNADAPSEGGEEQHLLQVSQQ